MEEGELGEFCLNWDRIKADYEAGIIPVRQIARREGVSDTAIHKRVKLAGWNSAIRNGARRKALDWRLSSSAFYEQKIERLKNEIGRCKRELEAARLQEFICDLQEKINERHSRRASKDAGNVG